MLWLQHGLSFLLSLIALVFMFGTILVRFWSTHPHLFVSTASSIHPLPLSNEAAEFWRNLRAGLDQELPSFATLQRIKPDAAPWLIFDRVRSSPRYENYELPAEQVRELKALRQVALDYALALQPMLPFVPGTRGIVVTAPPNAFAILTTSLWMLREAGSTLPVEVWIWDRSEWEEPVCDDIYPAFGAKCMIMADHYPANVDQPFHPGDTFTFKSLAMLFSSFEQILFLDNDCFPVNNPDSLFLTKPFTIAGIVLWPDYWASTASKYWYEIVQRPIPDVTERASTESGQILLNKATHAGLLVLAHFYIYHGKAYWYDLLSQGANGQGDKEVWLEAAKDLGLTWYAVNERPQRIGYRCADQAMPVGSGQSHPLDDFMYTRNGIVRHKGGFDFGEAAHPRILFIHHNFPKPDAMALFDQMSPTRPFSEALACDMPDGSKVPHRLWGPADLAIVKYGWDVEKAFWSAIRWTACVHRRDFKIWNEPSRFYGEAHIKEDLCSEVTAHWQDIFSQEPWSPRMPHFGARKEHKWGVHAL